MSDYEIVITPDPLELVLEDGTEIVIQEDGTEVVVQNNEEIVISNDELQVLALDAAPAWVYATKVTVSSTPPANPKIGDIWVVKG